MCILQSEFFKLLLVCLDRILFCNIAKRTWYFEENLHLILLLCHSPSLFCSDTPKPVDLDTTRFTVGTGITPASVLIIIDQIVCYRASISRFPSTLQLTHRRDVVLPGSLKTSSSRALRKQSLNYWSQEKIEKIRITILPVKLSKPMSCQQSTLLMLCKHTWGPCDHCDVPIDPNH